MDLRATQPLAERMRPTKLEGFVGQETVIGSDSILKRMLASGNPSSLILYGPPGVGKTTLARIIAAECGASFVELSAVSASVADVRTVIKDAKARQAEGIKTILFLDEIHRFNKSQQDALLPAVEAGTIILVGATTENPSVSINRALLSRCAVYRLDALPEESLALIVARAAESLGATLEDGIAEAIAERSGGDARCALNILESAWSAALVDLSPINLHLVEQASRTRPLSYDKGDKRYDLLSAFIKSMRGSDENAAIYYLMALLEAGEDPRVVARRMTIFASEDIGNADPNALLIATSAHAALEQVGLPEAQLNLVQAVIYLARAAKSDAVLRAAAAAGKDVREKGILDPPSEIRDSHTQTGRTLGAGSGYVNPHRDPKGSEFEFLPPALKGRVYYRPQVPERPKRS